MTTSIPARRWLAFGLAAPAALTGGFHLTCWVLGGIAAAAPLVAALTYGRRTSPVRVAGRALTASR